MIDWIASAWADFWHIQYMLRGAFVFSGIIAAILALIGWWFSKLDWK